MIETFFNHLFIYLTGLPGHVTIFRKHNNKLDANGDISFPLNKSAWKKYNLKSPISNYLDEKIDLSEDLIRQSKEWPIQIIKCNIVREKLNIYLNRTLCFDYVLTQILNEKCCLEIFQHKIKVELENVESDLSKIDLTILRLQLLKNVVDNLLKISGNPESETDTEIIYLTDKSKINEVKKIVCGVVIGNKQGKKNEITAAEYYSKRLIDMRLMAQHKYGLRVNSEPNWREFFEKLGNAAVIYDLLHVKPSRSIVINIENASSTNKGASFILYNCARLSTIFKNFDLKVCSGVYPPLPELNQIDFTLLNQHEEWELLYVYLMQYPDVVRSCVKDLRDCKLNVHNLCTFLDAFCALFSVYYRRIRILMDPREHLFPVLHARIYLLKAIQNVLHSCLDLLNISPVTQM